MTVAERPLSGRRIVVTRAQAQAAPLRALLEAEGAEVIEFPTIRLAPPADYGPLDRAIARLGEYRWIVFTSPNGVVWCVQRMRTLGRDPRLIAHAGVAAIGSGTAQALRTQGLRADLAPSEFRAEALVDALASWDLRGVRVLIPRAADARGVLPAGLRKRGALVDLVAVYQTQVERAHSPKARRRLLEGGQVDAVTFTSSSTVRNFIALLGRDGTRALRGSLVACIGPVTAATAREYGLRVGVVAETYTIPGLVAAVRSALRGGHDDA
jgi:uroporphyrinogen III methyltransferase / synthase